MKKMIDYYGGQYYLNVILKHHPHGWMLGVLDDAPGWKKGLPILKAMGDSNRRWSGARVSGLWHDNHLFDKHDIKPAVKIAKRFAKIIEPYPKKKFLLQPWLEAWCSEEDMQECLDECRKELPKRVKVVASRFMPKGLVEYHHTNSVPNRPHLFSYDGTDMLTDVTTLDVKQDMVLHKKKRCRVFAGWCSLCNGKLYPREKITREERAKRGSWLTEEWIKTMVWRMK